MFKLLVFAFCPSFAAPVWADQVKITLLGVGDVYNFAGGGKLSGFARLNAMAMAERVANPNIIICLTGICCHPRRYRGSTKGRTRLI